MEMDIKVEIIIIKNVFHDNSHVKCFVYIGWILYLTVTHCYSHCKDEDPESQRGDKKRKGQKWLAFESIWHKPNFVHVLLTQKSFLHYMFFAVNVCS